MKSIKEALRIIFPKKRGEKEEDGVKSGGAPKCPDELNETYSGERLENIINQPYLRFQDTPRRYWYRETGSTSPILGSSSLSCSHTADDITKICSSSAGSPHSNTKLPSYDHDHRRASNTTLTNGDVDIPWPIIMLVINNNTRKHITDIRIPSDLTISNFRRRLRPFLPTTVSFRILRNSDRVPVSLGFEQFSHVSACCYVVQSRYAIDIQIHNQHVARKKILTAQTMNMNSSLILKGPSIDDNWQTLATNSSKKTGIPDDYINSLRRPRIRQGVQSERNLLSPAKSYSSIQDAFFHVFLLQRSGPFGVINPKIQQGLDDGLLSFDNLIRVKVISQQLSDCELETFLAHIGCAQRLSADKTVCVGELATCLADLLTIIQTLLHRCQKRGIKGYQFQDEVRSLDDVDIHNLPADINHSDMDKKIKRIREKQQEKEKRVKLSPIAVKSKVKEESNTKCRVYQLQTSQKLYRNKINTIRNYETVLSDIKDDTSTNSADISVTADGVIDIDDVISHHDTLSLCEEELLTSRRSICERSSNATNTSNSSAEKDSDVEVDGVYEFDVDEADMVEHFVDEPVDEIKSESDKSQSDNAINEIFKGFLSALGKKKQGEIENRQIIDDVTDNIQGETLEIADSNAREISKTPEEENESGNTDDIMSEVSDSVNGVTDEVKELIESVKKTDNDAKDSSPEKDDLLANLVSFIRSNSLKLKRSLSKETKEITEEIKDDEDDDKTPVPSKETKEITEKSKEGEDDDKTPMPSSNTDVLHHVEIPEGCDSQSICNLIQMFETIGKESNSGAVFRHETPQLHAEFLSPAQGFTEDLGEEIVTLHGGPSLLEDAKDDIVVIKEGDSKKDEKHTFLESTVTTSESTPSRLELFSPSKRLGTSSNFESIRKSFKDTDSGFESSAMSTSICSSASTIISPKKKCKVLSVIRNKVLDHSLDLNKTDQERVVDSKFKFREHNSPNALTENLAMFPILQDLSDDDTESRPEMFLGKFPDSAPMIPLNKESDFSMSQSLSLYFGDEDSNSGDKLSPQEADNSQSLCLSLHFGDSGADCEVLSEGGYTQCSPTRKTFSACSCIGGPPTDVRYDWLLKEPMVKVGSNIKYSEDDVDIILSPITDGSKELIELVDKTKMTLCQQIDLFCASANLPHHETMSFSETLAMIKEQFLIDSALIEERMSAMFSQKRKLKSLLSRSRSTVYTFEDRKCSSLTDIALGTQKDLVGKLIMWTRTFDKKVKNVYVSRLKSGEQAPDNSVKLVRSPLSGWRICRLDDEKTDEQCVTLSMETDSEHSSSTPSPQLIESPNVESLDSDKSQDELYDDLRRKMAELDERKETTCNESADVPIRFIDMIDEEMFSNEQHCDKRVEEWNLYDIEEE